MAPAPIRLHWFWSTNPQKLRLALEELDLDHERIEVDLMRGHQKRDAFAELTPRKSVPVLEIDGTVLWESGAALAYLGQREQRLWPTDTPGLAMALNLLFLESAAFQDLAGIHFLNRVVLPRIGKEGDPAHLQKAEKKIRYLLDILETQLGENEYLLGTFSLVDCAYAPWMPVIDLSQHPRLNAWRDRLKARQAWIRCEFTY